MELREYLGALRKHWRVVMITALAVLALAATITLLMPRTYQSKVQFFVSTVDNNSNSQLASGSTFLQQRVKSYAQLLKAPIVLQPVIESAHLDMTPGELAGQVNTDIPTDSVLINVTVTARDPKLAQQISQGIGDEFPHVISDLEKVSANEDSPVKVTMTQDPTLDLAPVSPQPVRYLGLGLLVGLLLGVAVALIRNVLDSHLRTAEDVAAVAGDLTVIGSIPFDGEARKSPIIESMLSHTHRGEAFRSLRTNLRFIDAANHPRTIVMTSSVPGEGKTTTTANLALMMAESGASVCLIEGDLRRPKLLEYLGLEGIVGLTDVLISQAELDDVIQPFGENNLYVLGAGALPPNPSELLGSARMQEVLNQLSERFDYTLIDAPPLLPVTDAAVLSTVSNGVILVAGSGIVHRDQLAHALESLETVDSRILGVVLNRVARTRRTDEYYTYGYVWDSAHSERSAANKALRPEAVSSIHGLRAKRAAGRNEAANAHAGADIPEPTDPKTNGAGTISNPSSSFMVDR